jgi:hypothetical protein
MKIRDTGDSKPSEMNPDGSEKSVSGVKTTADASSEEATFREVARRENEQSVQGQDQRTRTGIRLASGAPELSPTRDQSATGKRSTTRGGSGEVDDAEARREGRDD